jgi:glucokinase
MILSGDIGGTHTRLGLFEQQRGELRALVREIYKSRNFGSLREILIAFQHSCGTLRISRACFGVAGPVKNGRCEATNLPWVVDSRALAIQLRLRSVGLINDLAANAWGIGALKPADLYVLNRGEADPESNAALIAAGTGLGEAGLFWDGVGHRSLASEGGHVDFAPRTPLEIDLLRELMTQFGRVSYERIVSGPGLFNVYRFLRDRAPTKEPRWLAEELAANDPPEVVSRNALNGRSVLCEQALDLFVSVYGAEAGNLALKMMATAGIYLGGGIAPKILPRLKGRSFRDAFAAKGRLSPLVAAIPVSVILNDQTALVGAARWCVFADSAAPRQQLPKANSRATRRGRR